MVKDTHYFNNTCTDDGCTTNNIRQGSYATKVTCSDGRSFVDFEADDASGTLFPNCDLVENSCDPAVECTFAMNVARITLLPRTHATRV